MAPPPYPPFGSQAAPFAADAPPSRSQTPPRTAAVSIRLLRICLDERVLGAVEVNDGSTLADVRTTIAEDEIPGVPSTFLFLFGGAPVTRRQECRRRAVDCFPFATIISEGSRVPPSSTAGSDTPSAAQADHGVSFGMAGPESIPEVVDAGGADVVTGEVDGDGPIGCNTLELQITDGPLEGTTVTFGEEGARIGRHTSNTLVIPEAGISRYHCEICYLNSEFCVRDLGSTTGTFFYLRPHGHFQMFTGLMVKLGETEFQVLSQDLQGGIEPDQVVLFYEGPLAGHKVHIPASGITIGRRHNNNLVLVQDGTVSAHHAMIFCEEGEFFINDLGSCNGTCVRLSPERTESDWHPIIDGDILGAGCTKIRCTVHR